MHTKFQSENENALVAASMGVNCHIACEDEVYTIGGSAVWLILAPCVIDEDSAS
jgi:hypothetical protein